MRVACTTCQVQVLCYYHTGTHWQNRINLVAWPASISGYLSFRPLLTFFLTELHGLFQKTVNTASPDFESFCQSSNIFARGDINFRQCVNVLNGRFPWWIPSRRRCSEAVHRVKHFAEGNGARQKWSFTIGENRCGWQMVTLDSFCRSVLFLFALHSSCPFGSVSCSSASSPSLFLGNTKFMALAGHIAMIHVKSPSMGGSASGKRYNFLTFLALCLNFKVKKPFLKTFLLPKILPLF